MFPAKHNHMLLHKGPGLIEKKKIQILKTLHITNKRGRTSFLSRQTELDLKLFKLCSELPQFLNKSFTFGGQDSQTGLTDFLTTHHCWPCIPPSAAFTVCWLLQLPQMSPFQYFPTAVLDWLKASEAFQSEHCFFSCLPLSGSNKSITSQTAHCQVHNAHFFEEGFMMPPPLLILFLKVHWGCIKP